MTMYNVKLKPSIENIWQNFLNGQKPSELQEQEVQNIEECVSMLDKGALRVASFENDNWITHEWVKKAILCYFKIKNNQNIQSGEINYFDKIPVKTWHGNEGVRIVPNAIARYGSHVCKGAILMPSYTNIGAWVGENTMIDTWATVGSCAQIGNNVHISGGVGIGGVLEPLQANPVIIEDNCFIGSRCIIVEGAIVKSGAVLGAGVTITSSTKILDVTNESEKSYKGIVPENSVVIPGTYEKSFPAGKYGVPCALIIGKRKASTDLKTSLNEALRDYGVSV